MKGYPDTSYLCALYRKQENSPVASSHFSQLTEPLAVTSLLLFEFRQACRLHSWIYQQTKRGITPAECERALSLIDVDLAAGVLKLRSAEWPEVHKLADQLSSKHTPLHGCRAMDTLHVATALYLKTTEFYTFDEKQALMAKAEGLQVYP